MYELLLKWGLENLSKFTGIKGEHELTVIKEAINTKNSIILERYKKSWDLYEKLVDLTLEVETALNEFLKDAEETDGTLKSARKFIGNLRSDFHPQYYRRLQKIRSMFEGSNDLIASYTHVFIDIVNIDTLLGLVKEKEEYSRGNICRLYRGLWTKYSEIVSILLRVTSADLRFWVTDTPYIYHTDEWAKQDLEKTIRFFKSNNWGGKRLHIALESRRGLDRFWYDLEDFHNNNKSAEPVILADADKTER